MSANGDCPTLIFPETTNCSGRGACSDTQCICEPGWTGFGDFVSGSPFCDLNMTAIQILWSLVFALHAMSVPFCVYYLRVKVVKNPSKSPIPLIMGICGLLASIFLCALGLLRATSPTRTIGTDVSATVLFSISAMAFWTYLTCVTSVFVNLLVGSIRGRNDVELRHIIRFKRTFQIMLPISWFFCQLACISPLFMLLNPNSATIIYGFAAVHFLVLASVMIVFSIVGQTVMTPVLRDIESVLREKRSDAQMLSIRWKFRRFMSEYRNQSIIQSASAATFGCWPFAQRYSSYEVPLAWMFTAFLIGFGLNAVLPSQISTSSGNANPGESTGILTSIGLRMRARKASSHVLTSKDNNVRGEKRAFTASTIE